MICYLPTTDELIFTFLLTVIQTCLRVTQNYTPPDGCNTVAKLAPTFGRLPNALAVRSFIRPNFLQEGLKAQRPPQRCQSLFCVLPPKPAIYDVGSLVGQQSTGGEEICQTEVLTQNLHAQLLGSKRAEFFGAV